MHHVDVASAAHPRHADMCWNVSNVMLLITVGFLVGVLRVGGGVWERLHSARVMNSASPEPVFRYDTVHVKSQRGRD